LCLFTILVGVTFEHLQLCAQHVTLQKYFSHPNLVLYFFCNPTHKTETGTANRWETTSSKPPGPIIMINQSETVTRSLFVVAVPFTSRQTPPHTLCNYAEPKPRFLEPNQHILSFLH
jgi:hypothetical protein